jgi:hypothetical protein
MKTINRIVLTALAICGLAPMAHTQVINTNGLQQVTLDQVGGATTYWLVNGPCPSPDGSPPPPYPFIPPDIADLNLPMYLLGSDQVLVDDSSVCYQAIETMNRLIILAGGGGPPPPPGPGGGTNGYGAGIALIAPTTNDLWLEITGTTNAGTPNGTASLIVHTPWNITNNVYDLFYATNLESPTWIWLLRTDPFGTNLTAIASDATNSYYRLGLNDLNANSSLGTNFWLALPPLAVQDHLTESLYISSEVGATGVVTIPKLQITNYFSISAGALTNILLDTNILMTVDENDTVTSDGIHVTATQPVAVYALHYALHVSASFTCYPTPLLGTNYCVMARPGNIRQGYDSFGFFGEVAIVAAVDNTTVMITPSPTANFVGHSDTNTFSIVLTNQGQVYLITTPNFFGDITGSDDPTGTLVNSDKPVAVFAGTDLANVPYAYCCANPLMQQQLPVESWGKQSLALSFTNRLNGDTYRVLAAYPDTVVLTNGIWAGTLRACLENGFTRFLLGV